MVSIKLDKYQAMKRYDNNYFFFLSSFIQCTIVIVMLGSFLSCPLWLPTLCSFIKIFFIESLPTVIEIIFGPKCLFLVFNLIIVFLIGKSRLSSSSSKPDILEEYVTHSQGLKGVSSSEDKGNEVALVISTVEGKKYSHEEERTNVEEEEGIDDDNNETLEEVEERCFPAAELNKRVEDFIARVNKQRRLEARMVVCCG